MSEWRKKIVEEFLKTKNETERKIETEIKKETDIEREIEKNNFYEKIKMNNILQIDISLFFTLTDDQSSECTILYKDRTTIKRYLTYKQIQFTEEIPHYNVFRKYEYTSHYLFTKK